LSTIQVEGLRSLKGEIEVQGSKNAVLPMMAASILHRGTTVITNVPRIQDVSCMMGILEYMGCACTLEGHRLTVDASVLRAARIPEHYVKGMRSSIMVLGAVLGRMGEALTHYPGGCSIGKRPIDLHLYVLRTLGAEITEEEELIMAHAPHLTGAEILFPYPSVGATENALLASVLAEGTTVIRGGAREPEIQELCLFLNNMGADIRGIGSDCLTVVGQTALHDSSYRVLGDRIVAGTYLAAVCAAGGDVVLTGIDPGHMDVVLTQFARIGARVCAEKDLVHITAKGRPDKMTVTTGPYPQFPTDLQSPMLAVASVADGESLIEETVFEGRYETAKELQKLGAHISVDGRRAMVKGTQALSGTAVEAKDLRGGAALVIAGLAAEGRTVISRCFHIQRGYEDICKDLSGLGARISYL